MMRLNNSSGSVSYTLVKFKNIIYTSNIAENRLNLRIFLDSKSKFLRILRLGKKIDIPIKKTVYIFCIYRRQNN